jgi:hypothetical protein
MTVTWGAVAGATGYVIYGRTTGAEQKIATVGAVTTYTDLGSISPSGALPTAATTYVTIKLYQGTTTLNSALATTGATRVIGPTGGAFNFEIEATLQWDITSQVLSGSYTSVIGFGTSKFFTGPTVVTNVTSALAISDLAFAGAVTFGFASSSNTITLRDFCLERL